MGSRRNDRNHRSKSMIYYLSYILQGEPERKIGVVVSLGTGNNDLKPLSTASIGRPTNVAEAFTAPMSTAVGSANLFEIILSQVCHFCPLLYVIKMNKIILTCLLLICLPLRQIKTASARFVASAPPPPPHHLIVISFSYRLVISLPLSLNIKIFKLASPMFFISVHPLLIQIMK